MRTSRAFLAAAGLALAVITAGCSVHPGAAAVVNGHEISESYVQDGVDDLTQLFDISPSDVLGLLVVLPAMDEVAARYDIVVTPADARDTLATAGEQNSVDASGFGGCAVDVARYVLMQQQFTGRDDVDSISADLQAAVAELDIDISPRFGTRATTGTISVPTPEWIVPSADATAAPEDSTTE